MRVNLQVLYCTSPHSRQKEILCFFQAVTSLNFHLHTGHLMHRNPYFLGLFTKTISPEVSLLPWGASSCTTCKGKGHFELSCKCSAIRAVCTCVGVCVCGGTHLVLMCREDAALSFVFFLLLLALLQTNKYLANLQVSTIGSIQLTHTQTNTHTHLKSWASSWAVISLNCLHLGCDDGLLLVLLLSKFHYSSWLWGTQDDHLKRRNILRLQEQLLFAYACVCVCVCVRMQITYLWICHGCSCMPGYRTGW